MKTKLIAAPFDDKHLCDDILREEIFGDFYECPDCNGSKEHRIGTINSESEDCSCSAMIGVTWSTNNNVICIETLACPQGEDFDTMHEGVVTYFTNLFKAWECPDNEYLQVFFRRTPDYKLYVSFYYDVEE